MARKKIAINQGIKDISGTLWRNQPKHQKNVVFDFLNFDPLDLGGGPKKKQNPVNYGPPCQVVAAHPSTRVWGEGWGVNPHLRSILRSKHLALRAEKRR